MALFGMSHNFLTAVTHIQRCYINSVHSFVIMLSPHAIHRLFVGVSVETFKVTFNQVPVIPIITNYSSYQRIPRILVGMGIVILSISQGMMMDQEAQPERKGPLLHNKAMN
jgi:hypothetical protein